MSAAPKFTPGPWHARQSTDKRKSAYVATDAGKAVVDAGACRHADASLIAAAPDLYEALRAMIAHRDEVGCADYPAVTAARAALAKVDA